MTPENQRDEDLKNDYPNDAETQEWMNASLGMPEKLGDRPIEEFIRNAGITVERDGEVFIEIVLNTVYELERRFSALRQSWEREKALDAEYRKLMQEALDAIKKEKAGLEERVKIIEQDRDSWRRCAERLETEKTEPKLIINIEESAIKELFKNQAEELTRLKSRNEELEAEVKRRILCYCGDVDALNNELIRLKAENESNYKKASDFQMELAKSVPIAFAQEQESKIDRLTSALARAHEALEYVDCQKFYTSCKEQKAKGKVFTSCHRCEALADPSGSVAFEKWRKMKELFESSKDIAENEVPSDEQWKRFESAVEALEALDAKGERE